MNDEIPFPPDVYEKQSWHSMAIIIIVLLMAIIIGALLGLRYSQETSAESQSRYDCGVAATRPLARR